PARRDISRPRLPIDRVFTLAGFGTIVTGTLVDGTFTVGDEAAILPSGRRARIRGIQTHRKGRESAQPGSRVALNLAGVDKDELERGMVVVRPGPVAATSLIAARLSLLPSASDPLVHDETVKVHVGTAEVMARASLLETNAIAPGGSSWAQLRLAAPTAVAVGDRFVIRRPSPAETLGGGEIADASGERVRRRADALASLERRAGPSPTSRLLAVLDVPRDIADAAARSGLAAAEAEAALLELIAEGLALRLGDAVLPPSPASLQTDHGIDAEVVAALAERGDLVRIGTEAVFLPDAVERFAQVVVDELAARRTITVSRARDLTGSSRKHVLPLLQ